MGRGTVRMRGEFGSSRRVVDGVLTSAYTSIVRSELSSYVGVEELKASLHQTHASASRSKKPQPLPIQT